MCDTNETSFKIATASTYDWLTYTNVAANNNDRKHETPPTHVSLGLGSLHVFLFPGVSAFPSLEPILQNHSIRQHAAVPWGGAPRYSVSRELIVKCS